MTIGSKTGWRHQCSPHNGGNGNFRERKEKHPTTAIQANLAILISDDGMGIHGSRGSGQSQMSLFYTVSAKIKDFEATVEIPLVFNSSMRFVYLRETRLNSSMSSALRRLKQWREIRRIEPLPLLRLLLGLPDQGLLRSAYPDFPVLSPLLLRRLCTLRVFQG